MAMKKSAEIVEIKPVELETATIRVVGDSPLIMHKWSEKAKRMMLEAQQKVTKTKAREIRNPVEDFITAAYWISDMPEEMTEEGFEEAAENGRWGFPATAFKQATISAAYRNKLVADKMSLRGVFFLKGIGVDQLIEIKGSKPHIREDMVKVGMGTADIRFRPQFDNWYADIEITYNKNGQYTFEQLVNLINIGGMTCGVGEWRPERDGSFGMYHVEATNE